MSDERHERRDPIARAQHRRGGVARAHGADAPDEHAARAGDRVLQLPARAHDPEHLGADPLRVAARRRPRAAGSSPRRRSAPRPRSRARPRRGGGRDRGRRRAAGARLPGRRRGAGRRDPCEERYGRRRRDASDEAGQGRARPGRRNGPPAGRLRHASASTRTSASSARSSSGIVQPAPRSRASARTVRPASSRWPAPRKPARAWASAASASSRRPCAARTRARVKRAVATRIAAAALPRDLLELRRLGVGLAEPAPRERDAHRLRPERRVARGALAVARGGLARLAQRVLGARRARPRRAGCGPPSRGAA